MPKLTSFIRRCGNLTTQELEVLAAADWPKLERLEVWLGGERSTVNSVEQLRPLITAARGWPLRTLGLINHELGPALLPELAQLDWVKRLERVSFAMCTFIDEDLGALVEFGARLEGQLDLTENQLSTKGVAELKRRLPSAIVERQRFDDWGPNRFVAVGE